ncbi:hypothetical protein AN1V17_30910 [Vallitalea sediminicola]
MIKRSIKVVLILMLTMPFLLFDTINYAASNGEVVINEICWMGTTTSAYDEWIELYNNTNNNIDLNGWTLKAVDGTPSINLSGTIPAKSFYLLERTDNTSVPSINADLIYTGSLENSSETLQLKDNNGNTIDSVNNWYAGNNGTKATMERINSNVDGTVSANWNSSTLTYQCGYGTPKALNSNSSSGSGSWTPGNLEIHHINIGQGNATLVVGPTGRSMLVDVGESYWNSNADASVVGPYVESVLGTKYIDYVLITHFHCDHIGYVGYGGLWNLVEQQDFVIGEMIHRDYNNYLGQTSSTFSNWKTYLEGTGNNKLNPIIAIEGTNQIDLGNGVTVDILTCDGNGAIIQGDFSNDAYPPSENDYSIGLKLSYGDFDEWIGGDLDGEYCTSNYGYSYHDIELSVAKEVGDVDVYLVNHHGSDHSSNATFVNQLDPEVSVVSVGDGNTYGHPRQCVMDLILATSDVYLTERGDINTNIGNGIVSGNVVIKTSNGIDYTVNNNNYVATNPNRVDSDGDGYYNEVDPDDGDNTIMPQPKGGLDAVYQP